MIVAGCETLPKREPITLSANQQQLFGLCRGIDGASQFHIQHPDSADMRFNVDWVSKDANQWVVEVVNPLGQSVAHAEWQGGYNYFTFTTRHIVHMPQLGADQQQRLTADGYVLPFVLKEMPCFLNGQLPTSWLENAKILEEKGDQKTLALADQFRSIEIVLKKGKTGGSNACAAIAWRKKWYFFKSDVELCVWRDSKVKGRLTFDDDIISWTAQGD